MKRRMKSRWKNNASPRDIIKEACSEETKQKVKGKQKKKKKKWKYRSGRRREGGQEQGKSAEKESTKRGGSDVCGFNAGVSGYQ